MQSLCPTIGKRPEYVGGLSWTDCQISSPSPPTSGNPPASVSPVLGLQTGTTVPSSILIFCNRGQWGLEPAAWQLGCLVQRLKEAKGTEASLDFPPSLPSISAPLQAGRSSEAMPGLTLPLTTLPPASIVPSPGVRKYMAGHHTHTSLCTVADNCTSVPWSLKEHRG